jgi:predicted ArsR family transcriptional regulator
MSDITSTLIKQMPLTRRRVLTLLKEKGKLTADELAQMLEISSVAVRRHLAKLEKYELVMYEEIQRGMGRPSYVYQLGEAAESFFPRGYEELAVAVLETIRGLYGPEAIDAVFRMRSKHLISIYRPQITGTNLHERLNQIILLRQNDGYMSTWEQQEDGTILINEANCPIIHVAQGCDSACQQDELILSELLDAEVIRKTHLRDGDNTCSYEVREKRL